MFDTRAGAVTAKLCVITNELYLIEKNCYFDNILRLSAYLKIFAGSLLYGDHKKINKLV